MVVGVVKSWFARSRVRHRLAYAHESLRHCARRQALRETALLTLRHVIFLIRQFYSKLLQSLILLDDIGAAQMFARTSSINDILRLHNLPCNPIANEQHEIDPAK